MFIPDYKIYNENNLHLLERLESNTLDAIVTDCPYGLGKEPNAVETLQAWITTGYHEISGKGFMGKEWDAFVPQPIFWKEAFRVLKPGGYVLAFFGTRTYDWGVMAIRLAGFEIRDCMQWIYGSGFPKSLNVSKAIDKEAGATREVIGTMKTNTGMQGGNFSNKSSSGSVNITASSTDEAKLWEGYGTALKPAYEPICVARKPLDGNVVDNVKKWGCGAVNIDGCRIEFRDEEDLNSATWGRGTDILGGQYVRSTTTVSDGRTNIEADGKGRWPSNVVFDEDAAALLDQQTGELTSGSNNIRQSGNTSAAYGVESRETRNRDG